MATPEKKTAAKRSPRKTTKTASEKALEARVKELESKLEASESREDRLARLVETVATPAAPVAPVAAVAEPEVGRTIRNLRGVPVHLRLRAQGEKEPYRVALEPRGLNGDIATIPEALTQTTQFAQSYHAGLFEIITDSEARDAHYGPTGFVPHQRAPIFRQEDTTIVSQQIQQDGKNVGKPVEELQVRQRAMGMNVVAMPGSDPQLTAQFQAMNAEAIAEDRALTPQYAPSAQVHALTTDPEAAKLASKGVLPPMPVRVTVEQGQGGQIQGM